VYAVVAMAGGYFYLFGTGKSQRSVDHGFDASGDGEGPELFSASGV
jgi:hypothetical protein